jgi:hypothetical protein
MFGRVVPDCLGLRGRVSSKEVAAELGVSLAKRISAKPLSCVEAAFAQA